MSPLESQSPRKEPLLENPSFWLIAPTLSLLLGQAVAASHLVLPLFALLFFLVPGFFLFRPARRGWACFVLLAGTVFAVGYGRHYQTLHPRFSPDHLRSVMKEGSPLYVEGVLHQEPERFPQRERWVVRSERVWHPAGAQEITGLLLLHVRQAKREWRYGDRIRVPIRPRVPGNGGNPGGFDYGVFLARRQIYATGFLENDMQVELLARGPPGFRSSIEHLRREIRRFIETRFSQKNGALLKALVVGDRGGLSRETRWSFTAAGVAHLLAISGLHVGMFALVTFFLVRHLGSLSVTLLLSWNLIKIAAFFSCLAALFYSALAGAMVPAVRAAIMITVYVLAVLLDREEEIFNSLCVAALIIALFWPAAAVEVSFQLSFLAVLFIVWGSRKIQLWWPGRRRDELPQERGWLSRRMRQAMLYLAVPVLATIGTGPMIAYHFGRLSLAGFIANPAVVPLVGFVLVPLGLLIGFLSLAAPVLALPLVWLAEPVVSLVRGMIGFFASLPLASIAVPLPNIVEVAILYLLILAPFLFSRKRYLFIAVGVLSLAFGTDGFYWWKERWDRKELRVTYLSVGHGDAAVVEFPGSKVLLIDAGGTATGEFDTGESLVAPFLRSRKILRVDYVLLSHPRVDHYGGMRTIIEEFAPSEFWSGPSSARTFRYEELDEAVERSGIERLFLSSGDPCRSIGRVRLCVLSPPKDKTGESSVVLRLSFGRVNLLFAGDIEKREERALLQSGADLPSAVLKVPRHGSLTASTEEFVAAVKPKLAIFSVGHRNRFGLPRGEVISRYREAGSEILRTDQDGAIVIETDGERIRYRTYGSGKKGEFFPGAH